MPRSLDADRELAEAREAMAGGAVDHARDAAWRAAAAAAQIGDEGALEEIVQIASTLAESNVSEADQLRVYAEACLKDAREGTRPPSMFERLLGRDLRNR